MCPIQSQFAYSYGGRLDTAAVRPRVHHPGRGSQLDIVVNISLLGALLDPVIVQSYCKRALTQYVGSMY